MEALTIVLVAVAGLVFGSFLNVVIYRLPRDQSLVRPPSTCPGCGVRIKPYDNVPVLSYFVLRGRCRSCGRKISAVYPLVEALTAGGFLLVYFNSGRALSLEFFAGCLFTSALIALGFIDYFHQILPDAITMPGLAPGSCCSFTAATCSSARRRAWAWATSR
jgi:leader peptidase (prepilin peptidase)/N-methyltransferase